MSNEIKVLDKGFVRLVRHMGDDKAVVDCARVSYGEGTKKVSNDEGLIRYLIRNSHTSPFECCSLTFHVKLPIFVSNQWVRHRTFSLNQISGRYSEMPNEFYLPDEDKVTKQNPNNKQGGTDEYVDFMKMSDEAVECYTELAYKEFVGKDWKWQHIFESEQNVARRTYEEYLKTGMRRELARINLPLSQYTEMYATINLHNLFHFLKLRLDSHAQYEIRVYAEAILKIIEPLFPFSVQAFKDYKLNSITLSSLDINAFQTYVATKNIQDALDVFKNKREAEEFRTKLIDILLDYGNFKL